MTYVCIYINNKPSAGMAEGLLYSTLRGDFLFGWNIAAVIEQQERCGNSFDSPTRRISSIALVADISAVLEAAIGTGKAAARVNLGFEVEVSN